MEIIFGIQHRVSLPLMPILDLYFKKIPYGGLKIIQIHVSPTTSGGPFIYAMIKIYVKYSRTYLNVGFIIHYVQ
jgi:hypothetical protein